LKGSVLSFDAIILKSSVSLFNQSTNNSHKPSFINLLDINHYSEYVMKEGLCELLVDWLNNETEDFKMY
jgi:hypothetical protein